MKFIGNGLVWDNKKNTILCRFDKDGTLYTDDEYVISRLRESGYFPCGDIVSNIDAITGNYDSTACEKTNFSNYLNHEMILNTIDNIKDKEIEGLKLENETLKNQNEALEEKIILLENENDFFKTAYAALKNETDSLKELVQSNKPIENGEVSNNEPTKGNGNTRKSKNND